MTPERWQQVDKLLEKALARAENERAVFLDQACAGDAELRQKVEALLAAHEKAGSFLNVPALELAAKEVAADQTQSFAGRQLGHYQVISLIGAGGMGEVYRAQDTRLDRTVALKILPKDVAADRGRLQRFTREAKAASALNHPNVATIYDVGEAGGVSFIAMEYVDGQTLQSRIAGSPLESAQIVDIGLQVADALDQAHAKGITHRDIKPANLMLTPRGQVKVLDFGLAKMIEQERQEANSKTATALGTMPGVVMGTVQYMSPEQVLGRDVDQRTDIFSLGATLYEMATGRLPFAGATMTETMDCVLHAQPEPISQLNAKVPAELERIVRKCLEKEQERRYQSASELLVDLRNLQRGAVPVTVTATNIVPSRWSLRRRLAVAALVVLAAVLLSLGVFQALRRDQPPVIAVLPFANDNNSADSEYLSDGITESLINSLSQLPKLRVLARTTVFRYKGQPADPIKIRQELGVQAVVTGRVAQRGDNLIIQAELVDATNGSQIWGEKYTRKLSDVLIVQGEIAGQILSNLRLKLSGDEQQRLTKHYTENIEAYYLYLKGRHEMYKFSAEGIDKAIQNFSQALRIDPRYALAFSGLSETYMIASSWYLPAKEAGQRAREAATKAVELDNALSEAHGALATVLASYDWEWARAEREFKQALALNPASRAAGDNYGNVLAMIGRQDDSISELRRARVFDPLSVYLLTNLGSALYFARRYDEAAEQLQKAIDLDPNFWLAHICLGEVYDRKAASEGNPDRQRVLYESAASAYQKTVAAGLPDGPAWHARGLALLGRRNEALKLLDEVKQSHTSIVAMGMAAGYLGLGDRDQTFAWLEKARDDRHIVIASVKVDPIFESLHSDPRFAALLRSMGLEP